jgi:uncharacterized protein (DUF1778 family)
MPRVPERSDRINLRLSPRAKRTIERAAAYADKTLTDFVTEVAIERAEAVVQAHETIALSPEAWDEFCRMLLDPPAPDAKLEAALAEHARVVRR